MTIARLCALSTVALLLGIPSTQAQSSARLESWLGIPARQRPAPPLAPLQGFQDHVRDGKLILSLDDAIRLAFANNTDIRLDQSAVDTASNNILRQFQPFDPAVNSTFTSQRSKTPAFEQLQGASILNSLSQYGQIDYSQTFATGTNFDTTFQINQFSTNSSSYFLNPYFQSNLQFKFTQPLLRNFGLLNNRAPILIAQRNLRQARPTFQSQISDILQQTITAYWNVVLQRQNLTVQRKSL